MRSNRLDQVQRLVNAALTRKATDRAAYLAGIGDVDPGLRLEVESLLGSRGEDRALQQKHHDADAVARGTTEKITAVRPRSKTTAPNQIGFYRILRQIGEGGMGIVYEAEQEKPVRRKVALKLIKWGIDSKAVVARFESERQALALMNHPSIASVYEAGSTPEGSPYFAMEYVPGIPITYYCDKHRLTIKERLELFIHVCEGVQHAHHKGIIHRDLKPSNVLVAVRDDRPLPKIIDFGVAKATSQRLTERTIATELGQLIGTPEYMSPEQAEMTNLDVDTRTDVYSLGVLLYELLVGAQPFPTTFREAGLAQILRTLREEEPARPSTRISRLGEASTTTASNRRVELKTLRRQLKGDLDWITMKTLEKDRTKRYATANDLAADIGRYLINEPVLAGPPSAGYRLTKFIRRHRVGVAAGILVSIASTVGIAGITIGLVQSRRAERRASAEAAKAAAINDFLLETFGSANPIEGRDRKLTVLEALDSSTARIEKAFVGQPEVEAAVRYTVGVTYQRLGRYLDAERLLRSALQKQQAADNQSGEARVETQVALGVTLHDLGRYDEAESFYRAALDEVSNLVDGEAGAISIKNNLALLLQDKGDYEASEPLYREVVASDRLLGGENLNLAISLNNLGKLLLHKGVYDEAENLLRESVAMFVGLQSPYVAVARGNLAALMCETSVGDDIDRQFQDAIETGDRYLGKDNPDLALVKMSYGQCLTKQGRYQEAEANLQVAHQVMLAAQHHRTRDCANRLLELYETWGKPEKAAEYRTPLEEARR